MRRGEAGAWEKHVNASDLRCDLLLPFLFAFPPHSWKGQSQCHHSQRLWGQLDFKVIVNLHTAAAVPSSEQEGAPGTEQQAWVLHPLLIC